MEEQHGYRRDRSTQSAVTVLTDDITMAFEKKFITGCVYFDFVQAFDRVQYNQLLSKYYSYGIRGKLLMFFNSYFTNRNIEVKMGEESSDRYYMIHGTPQGSSVSGLTFAMYINDTKHIFLNSKFSYYCDDLAVYVHGGNVHEVQTALQTEINALQQWCKSNGMIINIPKTKAMLFGRRSSHMNQPLELTIDGKPIENVDCFKYLAITLSYDMSFEDHQQEVCKNMTSRLYLLNRHKNVHLRNGTYCKFNRLLSTNMGQSCCYKNEAFQPNYIAHRKTRRRLQTCWNEGKAGST